jgi:hypothetical protein
MDRLKTEAQMNRREFMHVVYLKDPGAGIKETVELKKGTVRFNDLFGQFQKAGTQHYFMEQKNRFRKMMKCENHSVA